MKTSSDSKIIKSKTDVQLVLNYSNQYVKKNKSGSGANAASRVDMTFSSTTEPLSEIVWSQSKGFSLNCVDSSFTEEKTSLYRDVAPSSMVLSLLQSVTGDMSTTDQPINDVSIICAKSDISRSDSPTRHLTSDPLAVIRDCKAHEVHNTGSGDNMEKINTVREEPNLPNDQAKVETAITFEIKGNKSSTISGHVHRPVDNSSHQEDEPQSNMVITKDGLYTEVGHINEHEEGFDALKSSSKSSLEKLESKADNNLQTFNYEATCAAKSGVIISKSNKNENKSHGNVVESMKRNIVKDKSLSDKVADVSLSKEENDSRLSVESSCSAAMFSIGMERCNFQHQLIVGSKRVRNQFQETPHAKSYVHQDSSFINLISNMRKGFSQSTQDEGKSLAHIIANPDHNLLWPDPKLITRNKNEDPAPQNTVSKPNLQSTYCPCLKNVRKRNSHQVGEASQDFEPSNKVHVIDVTPISSCAENNSLCKQFFRSNKFEESTQRYGSGQSLRSKVRPINFLKSHENKKNYSVETKSCYHMEYGSSSSRKNKNKNKNDNVESYGLTEKKETTIIHKSDNLEGLWISRFFPKSTTPLMTCDHLNEIGGSQLQSTDFSTLPRSDKRFTYLNNCKIEETGEQPGNNLLLIEAIKLQKCCVNKKTSTGLKGSNDHISRHNFSSITPFPGFSDSEEMTTMFARRLGAIKHMPTNRTESIPHR
ncbi:hypothetical protein TanjilG_32130 [Lupinus angustifolius]|uniref:Uncharacterized protein n=1 Tax=Lupinus angustifolius TaxID=3871 RepID=A0A394DMV0_LUPAN|nr:hypothetical protein TanjilG_32130 [Lupinus angustifolius]